MEFDDHLDMILSTFVNEEKTGDQLEFDENLDTILSTSLNEEQTDNQLEYFDENLDTMLSTFLHEEQTGNIQLEFDENLDMIPSTFLNDEETGNQLEDPGLEIPFGFRFVPTDEELIKHYLRKKINNEHIPHEFIPSVNVYKNHPQELTDAYPSLGVNEWYFFTPRDKKYLKGDRPKRTAGNGYWKATAADKRIWEKNVCIGSKRSLVFFEGNHKKSKKTNWLMQEYMINQPPSERQHKAGTSTDMLLDECVLCRIYMNSRRYAKVDEDALGHHNIDLLVQQPNYVMQQQNFPTLQYSPPRPTDQNQNLDGSLHYCLESTSDHNIDLLGMQQQNFPTVRYNPPPPTDQNQNLGGPLHYYLGSTSDHQGRS